MKYRTSFLLIAMIAGIAFTGCGSGEIDFSDRPVKEVVAKMKISVPGMT